MHDTPLRQILEVCETQLCKCDVCEVRLRQSEEVALFANLRNVSRARVGRDGARRSGFAVNSVLWNNHISATLAKKRGVVFNYAVHDEPRGSPTNRKLSCGWCRWMNHAALWAGPSEEPTSEKEEVACASYCKPCRFHVNNEYAMRQRAQRIATFAQSCD